MKGTAPEGIRHWLLVEYRQSWPPKFKVDDLLLAPHVKERVAVAMTRAGTRLLLIRRPLQGASHPPVVYWVDAETGVAKMAAQQSQDWDLLSGAGMTDVAEPLILVCTHGSRDACCAKKGGRIFKALRKLRPRQIWQSSHLGGHRFAATLLTLPDGRLYGRILAEDCEPLISALESGDIFNLAKLRGLTSLPRPAQFAEVNLLEMGRKGLELVDMSQESDSVWRLRFHTDRGMIEARVDRVLSEVTRCASCGDATPRSVSVFRLSG